MRLDLRNELRWGPQGLKSFDGGLFDPKEGLVDPGQHRGLGRHWMAGVSIQVSNNLDADRVLNAASCTKGAMAMAMLENTFPSGPEAHETSRVGGRTGVQTRTSP